MSDRDAFIGYVTMDWIDFGRCTRLHSPASFKVDLDGWCLTDVTTACGRHTERAFIPGIFTRISAPRCARCCAETDLPPGIGSPKNDDACRRILGLEAVAS